MGLNDLRPLIRKYSVSGPRYTSYPTAPQWSERVDGQAYQNHLVSRGLPAELPLGLYVHIPFCTRRCHYCGCNTDVVADPEMKRLYVDGLLSEIERISGLLGGSQRLSQISLGGGTPTSLESNGLERLFEGIRCHFSVLSDADISIEVDPRVTDLETLKLLKDLGVNRLSFGVQDLDPEVQKAVNRIQPASLIRERLEQGYSLGFRIVNFDLIYGLPLQSVSSFQTTLDMVVEMRPSRIALYNFAWLPQMLKHQEVLSRYSMPSADERTEIFLMAYEKFVSNGYVSIGMDHFASKEDELSQALASGKLNRGFMGYMVKKSADLLGIGASSIGELWGGYFQNLRATGQYLDSIGTKGLAVFRGHFLTDEDKRRKWVIQRLMCHFGLSFRDYSEAFPGESFRSHFQAELEGLKGFEEDGVVVIEPERLLLTPRGSFFVRNVAMVFDAYLPQTKTLSYSKTV